MKKEEVRKLINKFLDGDTTLEEERALYAFFGQARIAGEFLPYREMFRDYAALPLLSGDMASVRVPRQSPRGGRWVRRIAGIAASALLVLGVGMGYRAYENHLLAKNYGGSYMIVNGKRIDNLRQIRRQIKSTLDDARRIEQNIGQEDIISDAEREVLESMDSPQKRAEMEQLLKD